MRDIEHRMQVALVKWLRHKGIFVFAIPNGGARNRITGKRLKDEGVLAGVPDLFIPAHKLFIELKAPGGKLSEAQKECHAKLFDCGCKVAVCYSVEEAAGVVMGFIKEVI